MATLTVQSITRTGVVPAPVAVDPAGDQFSNVSSDVIVEIWNDHASASRTATFVTPLLVDTDLAVADRAVTVTAAEDRRLCGRFQSGNYNDGSNYVQVTYSDSGADMRIGVYRFAD